MSSINIRNLTVSLSNKTLFDGLNLTIPAGKYQLRGENGVGKSTLLKVICGLLRPDNGEVMVADKTELVSDDIAIPPEMTVSSVFRLYDQYDRCDVRLREQLVDDFVFREHLAKTIESLSQGSLQKLKIILAVSGQGKWLLLDEAFNGLDQDAIVTLNSIIAVSDRPMILVDHANLCTLKSIVPIHVKNASLCITQ